MGKKSTSLREITQYRKARLLLTLFAWLSPRKERQLLSQVIKMKNKLPSPREITQYKRGTSVTPSLCMVQPTKRKTTAVSLSMKKCYCLLFSPLVAEYVWNLMIRIRAAGGVEIFIKIMWISVFDHKSNHIHMYFVHLNLYDAQKTTLSIMTSLKIASAPPPVTWSCGREPNCGTRDVISMTNSFTQALFNSCAKI